jgi:hypothetical protein
MILIVVLMKLDYLVTLWGVLKMKFVHKVDIIIFSISLLSIMIIIGYASPYVIAPIDNFQTIENEILFKINNADVLFIDDNIDFTTPDEYKLIEGLKLNLEPGTYYWKVKGVFGSEIRTLTINSKIDLQLRKTEEGFELLNIGNVRLDVEVYNGTSLIERRKVNVGESFESSGDKFIGGMVHE